MKHLAISELVIITGGESPTQCEEGTAEGYSPVIAPWNFDPNDPRNQPWPRREPRVV